MIHRIYSVIFVPTTLVPEVTPVPSAAKHLPLHLASSNTRTFTPPSSRSSARCASKRTRSSRICVGTSGCTPTVACRSSATSAARASAPLPHCRNTSVFVIPPTYRRQESDCHPVYLIQQRCIIRPRPNPRRQPKLDLAAAVSTAFRNLPTTWPLHPTPFRCSCVHPISHHFRQWPMACRAYSLRLQRCPRLTSL